ncbi:tigger transposable element-derived protein 6-like protein, partial [Dinothrombium tinctorium]
MALKRKRNDLDLKQKVKLIKEKETKPDVTQEELSKKFKIGRSTVSEILKNKLNILKTYENFDAKRKRTKVNLKYSNLDEIMWEWFKKASSMGLTLSGSILQEKVQHFAQQLSIDFKDSNGWLEKFKKRHQIKSYTVSGESGSVDIAD